MVCVTASSFFIISVFGDTISSPRSDGAIFALFSKAETSSYKDTHGQASSTLNLSNKLFGVTSLFCKYKFACL